MELEVRNVSRSFHKYKAVSNVNYTFTKGIVGLLGANGSGKTTLLRMLVGNISPTDGEIYFNGKDIHLHYDPYVSVLGYLPQHVSFYSQFKVVEFLSYMGVLKGLDKKYCKQRIQTLLEELNLLNKANKKIKTLSGGMLRRVGIATALLNEPKVLILDEPTAGLDPKERNVLKKIIGRLAETCLVIISTHIVSDIEHIASEIILLKEGKIILSGKPEEIANDIQVYEVEVSLEDAKVLERKYTVVGYLQEQHRALIRIVSDKQPHSQAVQVKPTLDDVYLSYFKEERL